LISYSLHLIIILLAIKPIPIGPYTGFRVCSKNFQALKIDVFLFSFDPSVENKKSVRDSSFLPRDKLLEAARNGLLL
jgi:hypothetical protein